MIRQNTMDELKKMTTDIELIMKSPNSSVETNTNTNENANTNVITNTNVNTNVIASPSNKSNKIKKTTLEILISVCIHTFIMAVFEIYFYFEYIIVIEKKMFMDKISQYTHSANLYIQNLDPHEKEALIILFPKKNTQQLITYLYNDYQISLHNQQHLLEKLLVKSYKMLAVITSILLLFLSVGLYQYKKEIKWKHIMIENVLMFTCLGIFEYLFFMNIIMYYSPVTDEEIKYTIVKELVSPFMNTTTTATPLLLVSPSSYFL